MIINLISFTNKGYELGERIAASLPEHDAVRFQTPGPKICSKAFADSVPLVFIGAIGIAVRYIAPYVKDKLSDPPVLAIDELGRFVVPLLSGHMGGANELALEIADAIGAIPVISTASDINDSFAVDVFAKEQGLSIANRKGIAGVSARALESKTVTMSIKDYPPARNTDVLVSDELMPGATIILCPKKYAVGIGCRRGKSYDEIRSFAERILSENGINLNDVGCIATIDIKEDEEGLKELSQAWRMPIITYEAAILKRAEGDFSSSERVLEAVGVDNVCERASILACGPGAELAVRKTAENGITLAVAKRK